MQHNSIRQTHKIVHKREACRTCNGSLLEIIDFGFMPLAGAFLPSEATEETLYPLTVCYCSNCYLVQIPEVIPKEELFYDHYKYISSVMGTLRSHFEKYADKLCSIVAHHDDPIVVEFGSNDGILLTELAKRNVRAIGVDASANVVDMARQQGHDVEHAFFDPETARRIVSRVGKHADVLTGSNVFAHNDDVDLVLEGAGELLSDSGLFIVEVHYLIDLIDEMQFDFFYHEHCNYYCVTSLSRLFEKHGFVVVDVERTQMHGGSLRVFAQKESLTTVIQPSVSAALTYEKAWGIGRWETFSSFSDRVYESRTRINTLLNEMRAAGKRVCGYGASGRSVTLLNFLGPNEGRIDFMLDDSHLRAGTLLPGLHVPVRLASTEVLNESDACIITAWSYADEIMAKHDAYASMGGQFIVPLPKLELL